MYKVHSELANIQWDAFMILTVAILLLFFSGMKMQGQMFAQVSGRQDRTHNRAPYGFWG